MSKHIKPNDWRRRLHVGDEVTWNDPDEGQCTRTGVICEIRYIGGDIASITFTDGWRSEVFLSELS
jgi:hypothetical protein